MTAIFRPGSSIRHVVCLDSFFLLHRQAARTPGGSMAESTLSKHLMIPLKLDVSNENSHEVPLQKKTHSLGPHSLGHAGMDGGLVLFLDKFQ